jgi:hypothetical protein
LIGFLLFHHKFLLLHHNLELGLLLSFLCTHVPGKLLELVFVLEDNVSLVSLISCLFKITVERIQVVGLGFGH